MNLSMDMGVNPLAMTLGTPDVSRRASRKKKASRRKKRGQSRASVNPLTPSLELDVDVESTGSPLLISQDNVVDMKRELAARTLQRHFQARKLRQTLAKRVKLSKQRRAVMTEMFTTEQSYVKALQDSSKFSEHLEERGVLQSLPELACMFAHMQQICEVHEMLLLRLGPMMEEPTWTQLFRETFTTFFLQFSPKVGETYSPFLYGREKALKILGERVKTDKKLMASLETVQNENNTRRGMAYLDSLTVAPVQRLPRYNLLLQELLKVLPEDSEERRNVEQTLEHIANATALINERKRAHDDTYRLESLMENASIRELSLHEFSEARLMTGAPCNLCGKTVVGVGSQQWKCTVCNEWFHHKCKESEERLRSCLQRKPLNLREKKLLHQQEVVFLNANDSNIQQLTKGHNKRTRWGTRGLRTAADSRRHSEEFGVSRKKCLLCLFEDGLGICHVELEGEKEVFDFIGELPWRVVDETQPLQQNTAEHAFVVRAKFQEWHLAMDTQAEMEALVARLNEGKSAFLKKDEDVVILPKDDDDVDDGDVDGAADDVDDANGDSDQASEQE